MAVILILCELGVLLLGTRKPLSLIFIGVAGVNRVRRTACVARGAPVSGYERPRLRVECVFINNMLPRWII